MSLNVAEFNLRRPLVSWPSPKFETALKSTPYRLSRRWKSLRWRRDLVVWIAPRGIELFGGFGGRLRQRLQLQHDLGTAQVFLQKNRDEQCRWMGEDWLRRSDCQMPLQGRVPDAVIRDERERLSKAIEFGGRYSRRNLYQFSRRCMKLGLPYEIW